MSEILNAKELKEWNDAATNVAASIGRVLLGNELALCGEFNLEITDTERTFEPTPIVRPTETGLSVICNIAGYDEWARIFGASPVLDDKKVRDMYLATGLAWVELVVLANNVTKQQQFIDGSYITKAQRRAGMLAKEIDSTDKLAKEASKVSEMGIDGIVECIRGLSPEEIKIINKYRYGVAIALQVVELSADQRTSLQKDLFAQLVSGVQGYKNSIREFLTNFVLTDMAEKNAEISFKKGFPYLMFASTFPMNVSHINARS